MKTQIKIQKDQSHHQVSAYLMGQNLEMYKGAIEGLLSDRLENPKFAGTAHPTSGIAEQWQGEGALIPGLGLSSDNAQRVDKDLYQKNRNIYRGETLEVELWAKTQHAPVEVSISLRSKIKRKPPYIAKKMQIDSAYYKRYVITLNIPCDDTTAILTLSVAGAGILFLDQIHLRPIKQPLLDTQVFKAFQSLKMSHLRFPGGCISNIYRWKNGTGPNYLRTIHQDPQFHGRVSYDFGTDEYLAFCSKNNITPHITVNIGSQTPIEAEAWACYCRKFYKNANLEPPMIFFQIGNEQYAAHSTAHMTGEMYVEAFQAYVPLIKKAYPNSKIIAVGYPYSGETALRERTQWRELLLDRIPELIDVIAIHFYKGQWHETVEEQQQNAVASIGKIRNDLKQMIHEITKRQLTIKIAVTEWNYWLYANGECDSPEKGFHEPMDPNHSLFVAGMLHMMAELGAYVEIANFYHLLNGLSIFRSFGGDFKESPLAEIFRFYKHAFPAVCQPLFNDSPFIAMEEKNISSIMLRGKKKNDLFVINFSAGKNVELTLPEEFSQAIGEALIFEDVQKGKETYAVSKIITPENRILPPYSIVKFTDK